jgi:hypothetical protein
MTWVSICQFVSPLSGDHPADERGAGSGTLNVNGLCTRSLFASMRASWARAARPLRA